MITVIRDWLDKHFSAKAPVEANALNPVIQPLDEQCGLSGTRWHAFLLYCGMLKGEEKKNSKQ